ncbi:MAG: hypothetical protein IJ941_01355 [Clostridia bacterium]|nr:hypothetical protein [Clostridia bacterium]
MKKIFAFALILALLFTLTACGGSNKNDIVGTWHILDEETATEYGIGIEFTKDGKLRYGLTEDMFRNLADEEMSDKEWDEAMEGLDMLMSIEYDVKSDTEMKITVSAMFGLAKESTTIPYKLEGDTLTFDGATYTRVK